MVEGISNFYREAIAPRRYEFTPEGNSARIDPLTRTDYIGGSGIATLFLIQKIALSVFFLAATIFTCFQHQSFKASLLQNTKEIPIYLGAIALGYLGAIMPETVNERVLHIPSNGLPIPMPILRA